MSIKNILICGAIGLSSCAYMQRQVPKDTKIVYDMITTADKTCDRHYTEPPVRIVDEYPDGSLAATVKCKYGLPMGEYSAWHENGQRSWHANFSDGRLDGLAEAWDPDGKKWLHAEFDSGVMDGQLEVRHFNGNLWMEGRYSDGMMVGVHRTYTLDGMIETENDHRKGDAWLKKMTTDKSLTGRIRDLMNQREKAQKGKKP
ncbi:MAG: hypothetical protein V1729_05485 [Candidatus Woesearchaeota archaeon]